MNEQQHFIEVVDERGELGILDLGTNERGADANLLAIRLGDGARVFVTAEQLTIVNSSKQRFAGLFENLRRQNADLQTNSTAVPNQQTGGEIVVPIIAEEIFVEKRMVESGGVRIHKTVRENLQIVDEPIIQENVDIERVAVNQFVETAPGIRYEGDTMIIPILEEVVVTQKRIFVREEIRVTKTREQHSNPQEITLRREEINFEEIESDSKNQ